MAKTSQQRAVANNRRRLAERGMDRYEVRGLKSDKTLLRMVAKRLAANDTAAAQLRCEIAQRVAAKPGHRGGILAALRQSALVGAELRIEREVIRGRDVAL